MEGDVNSKIYQAVMELDNGKKYVLTITQELLDMMIEKGAMIELGEE